MSHRFAEIVFTDSVKVAQQFYCTREHNEHLEAHGGPNAEFGAREIGFIAARDSFYMATVGESGWPYVQHRGGRTGFLKVPGPRALVFGDFRGNLQYVSVGNIRHDDRVCLILVDYPNRRRLKILGRARVIDVADAPADLVAQAEVPGYGAPAERLMWIDLEAFDWNCSKHITPRFTESEVQSVVQPLTERIALLEARLRGLGVPEP